MLEEFSKAALVDKINIIGVIVAIVAATITGFVGLSKLINSYDRRRIQILSSELENEVLLNDTVTKELAEQQAETENLKSQLATFKTGEDANTKELQEVDDLKPAQKYIITLFAREDRHYLNKSYVTPGLVPNFGYSFTQLQIHNAGNELAESGWITQSSSLFRLTPEGTEKIALHFKK